MTKTIVITFKDKEGENSLNKINSLVDIKTIADGDLVEEFGLYHAILKELIYRKENSNNYTEMKSLKFKDLEEIAEKVLNNNYFSETVNELISDETDEYLLRKAI